jgi:hypothetical protein
MRYDWNRSTSAKRLARARRHAAWRVWAAGGVALYASLAPGALAAGTPPDAARAASHGVRAARTLNATDTARLHYVRSSGSVLFEEGTASGTLPGSMRARCNIGASFTASFTLYTRGGTITGHGTATPHGSGTYESFAGTLTATGGTGRYVHAHGRAGLYGVFNRRTYALTIQTTGRLSY